MNMKADFNRAKAEAEQVLRNNFITQPPIVAETVARNYGLNVRFLVFKPEFFNVSGFIDNKGCLIVNAEESPRRQNFTIAHELGHYLLGHLQSPDYGVLYRRPMGEQPDKPIEQEANCFAANLLVPEGMLRDTLKEFPFADNHQLGILFGVSADVIGYRCKDLGL